MSHPTQEESLSNHDSRIVGALLGVHAGDSLGATLEFAPHDLIASEYPGGLRKIVGGGLLSWSAGQATDDTEMTRSTDPEALIVESERISRVTHDDKKCTVSCAAYNMVISKLINGNSVADAIAAGQNVVATLKSAQVKRAIELGKELSIATMAKQGASPKLKDNGNGFVLDSLSIAIAALLDNRELEDVLVDVVRIGGDTDTNAAIAGGLLGARDGEAGIPPRWRTKLQYGDEFKSIALELLRR
ncbi:hypothetical protein LB507_004133 [Fusarium sp. FIESC RH6]|nr:hypothetical protein LB507_004133 [Fusarium sp. FIESC RH6]